MKRTIALALAVLMCAGLFAACSTLGEDDKGAIISMYISSFPTTLDPAAMQTDAETSKLLALLYQPLTSLNEKGEVKEGLSYEWYKFYDKRDDLYKMYFKLNETKWNDGRAVSADDIVYAWKRILAPESESPFASLLYPIKNARAYKNGEDGKTSDDLGLYASDSLLLEVVFEKKFNGADDPEFDAAVQLFAETVSNVALSPMREDIITKAEKDAATAETSGGEENTTVPWYINAAKLTTNGPFRLQGLTEGERLVLERNSYYYRDETEDPLDESVIPYRLVCIYQEGSAGRSLAEGATALTQAQYQYNRYNEGHIFYLNDFDINTFTQAADDVEQNKTLATYTYLFNTKTDVLSDAKVRKALSIALSRDEIVKLTGGQHIASTGYIPSGVFNTDRKTDFAATGTQLYNTAGDLDGARALLSEAGNPRGSLTLKFVYPTSRELMSTYKNSCNYASYEESIANYAKDVWGQLGFNVTVEGVYPEDVAKVLAEGDFDVIGIDNTIQSVDAFGYLAPFSPKYSGNKVAVDFDADSFALHYTGLEDDAYDALIDEIVQTFDRTKRAELLHQAEAMLHDLSPATALFQYNDSYLVADDLKGVKSNYYGYRIFNDLKLKNYEEINSKEAADSAAAAEND